VTSGSADTLHLPEPRAAEPVSPTLWGLDVEALHDRFWAAHGVDVIRRGQRGATRPGACYLLLEPGQMVVFDLASRRHLLRRGRLLALRVVDTAGPPYDERVTTDADDRLLTIQRRYRRRRRAAWVLVTRDRALAARWRSAPSHRRGPLAMRVAAGARGERRARCAGRVFDAGDPRQARRFLRYLMRRWTSVGDAILPARMIRPGVWAHVSASIHPAARLVGPLWIGAGVDLGADEVVAGPAVLHDRNTVIPPMVVRAGGQRALPLRSGVTKRRARDVIKRLTDIVVGSLVLAVTAPLFPLIMIAIWLEDGRPVLFAHPRQTIGGRTFACYKFRTMRRDAERCRGEIAGLNVCDGPHFHVEDDPRLLKVGRVLRRYHLDELPQLLSVIRGQMSIVGPRPSPDEENQYCPPWREARLSVRPGITGLWQVRRTRAPQRDFQEWIRHDLDYVDRRTWRLDLAIATRTAWQLTRRLVPRRAA
jgi:lipopolysaccharide/colanic/teichoic acid biosynthesis glycosyltransferase